MTVTDEDIEFVNIDPIVEVMLQENHDAVFVWTPYARHVEPCATCDNKPLWGCALWPCDESQSCFIVCPSCGQFGFGDKPEGWVPDWELAAILLEKMGR